MTARLPTPGKDPGTWGGILNDFLAQSHNSDGTLKLDAVNATGVYSKPGTGIPASDLDSATQANLAKASTTSSASEGSIWNTSTVYVAGKIVTFTGARYITPAGAPVSAYFDTTKWVLLGSVPDTF